MYLLGYWFQDRGGMLVHISRCRLPFHSAVTEYLFYSKGQSVAMNRTACLTPRLMKMRLWRVLDDTFTIYETRFYLKCSYLVAFLQRDFLSCFSIASRPVSLCACGSEHVTFTRKYTKKLSQRDKGLQHKMLSVRT